MATFPSPAAVESLASDIQHDHGITTSSSSSLSSNLTPTGSTNNAGPNSTAPAPTPASTSDPADSTVTSCKQCGSVELDSDASRGDTVCMNCGYVLEESLIVSEVCFEEDGHGGASAVGQFVSSESKGGGGVGLMSGGGGGGGSGAGGYHQGVAKESREITLRAAKKKITEVAQQLRLNQHCIDVAFNFFKMALHKQLTKGRKHPLTVAACIYMTCRIEGTPHLLIDFSDVVQMDIYALGRAYIQISRALFINIPAVDPCMYILRFAHKFNLGDKTHEVAMTAIRLVQRMKRDWIHLGRRPSGLCGAALLIAARLHNFSRTVYDIIQVVKVHETTLRKRLVEFGETPSSSLTIEEFMSVDLEEEHDPPSFRLARIRDREHLQRLMEEDSNISLEMTELQSKIEDELQKRRKVKNSTSSTNTCILGGASIPYSLLSPTPDPSLSKHHGHESETATRFIVESTLSTINTIISNNNSTNNNKNNNQVVKSIKSEKQAQQEQPKNKEPIAVVVNNNPKNLDLDRILMPPPSPATTPASATAPNIILRPSSLNTHTSNSNNKGEHQQKSSQINPPPHNATSNIKKSRDEVHDDDDQHKHEHDDDDNEDDEDDYDQDDDQDHKDSGELDFSDIDDDEIDSYIMSDQEAERKRIIWERLNNDYIIAQEQKKKQLEQDILDGKFDKKKRNMNLKAKNQNHPSYSSSSYSSTTGGSSSGTYQAKSASEAIKIMLTERKMSSKINYDVLRALASSVGDNILEDPSTKSNIKKLPPDDDDEKVQTSEAPVDSKANAKLLGSGSSKYKVIESGQVIPSSTSSSSTSSIYKRPSRHIKTEKDEATTTTVEKKPKLSGGLLKQESKPAPAEKSSESSKLLAEACNAAEFIEESEQDQHDEEEEEEEEEEFDEDDEEEEEEEDAEENIEQEAHHPELVEEEVIEEPLIVEEGPVIYSSSDGNNDVGPDEDDDEEEEDEEEYDEEVDEDETHTLSAKELLTKFRGNDEDDEDNEHYDENYY